MVIKDAVYLPIEYYKGIKKNEILPFVTTWTCLESIVLNEIKQTNKKNNNPKLMDL